MKDKKWLKDEVVRIYDTRDYWSVDDLRDEILDSINELDEPEVLLREETINMVLDDLKEHIEEQQSLSQNVGMAHAPAGNDTHYRQYDYVLECIKEYEPSDDLHNLIILKQELPVLPKHVADYIDGRKEMDFPIYQAIRVVREDSRFEDSHLKEWLWTNKGQEVFARAWLDGFTVKEEQKYYAKLKEIRPLEGEWLTNLSGPNYYVLDTKGLMLGEFILDLVGMKTEASTHTLKDWERYGINDSNADFVRVKEVVE